MTLSKYDLFAAASRMKLLSLSTFAVSLMLTACAADSSSVQGADDRTPVGKADQTGSCQVEDENFCGGSSDGNCWCDDSCEAIGDCCADKPVACDGEEPVFCPDGDIEASTVFTDASDGAECATEVLHCLTTDFDACPQIGPLPSDFCEGGEAVQGDDSYIGSADGMECSLPSVHCLTTDLDACPLLTPRPSDFCEDGVIEVGPSSFVPSGDGMECELPSVHCTTADPSACEDGGEQACEGGQVALEQVFVDAQDPAFQCEEAVQHCLTDDLGACPQLTPLPEDYCEDGDAVQGAPSYLTSGDGKECEMPSTHCLTRDLDACPLWTPLPSDYCEGGEAVSGSSSFIPSADGMECEIPSVHCVTTCGE